MDSWLYDPGANRVRQDVETYGPALLPKAGVAVVAGASNTGKSTWLLAMMHYWNDADPKCPEYDDDIMGYIGYVPSFWYFAFEDGANMCNAYDGFRAAYPAHLSVQNPDRGYRRLQDGTWDWHSKITQSLFAPPAGSLDLTNTESVDAFLEAAHLVANAGRLENPDVIIIDNLSLCIGDADENDSLTARKVIRGLERIREYFGETRLIILVHHTARDSDRLRGSEVLFNLAQGVVILSGTGDTVTARCTKMKGSARGAVRKYRRTPMQGPAASYVDYVDITDTAAKPAKAAPAPKASPTPADAVQAPVAAPAEAPAPALPPPAPKHPAEGLRGLPLEVWQLLALGTGESITGEAAKAKAMTLPTFEAIEPRRRNDRWGDVLESFTNKGLYDHEAGLILNR